MVRAPLALLIAAAAISTTSVSMARPGKGGVETEVRSSVSASLKRGDLKGAAEKIRRAREADPSSPSLALLQAQLLTRMDDAARAMRAYQEYLRLAGKDGSTKDRAEAVARIQDLSVELGVVVVRAKPGARVMVDGEFVGTTPLADPVPVAPGQHVVALDGTNSKRALSIKAEESTTVELEGASLAAPAPTSSAAPQAVAPPPPEAPPKPEPSPFDEAKPAEAPPKPAGSKTWIGWTAAGVLGAGAIASGVVAAGAVSSYQSQKETFGTTRETLEGTQSRAQLFSGAAIGLGAAAATVATITFLTSRPSKEKDKPRPDTNVGLIVSPGFVGATGSFR